MIMQIRKKTEPRHKDHLKILAIEINLANTVN